MYRMRNSWSNNHNLKFLYIQFETIDLAGSGLICLNLARFAQIWIDLDKSGQICLNLARSGQIMPDLAKSG